MTDILAVPGLAEQTPAFVSALAELAARNGWDPNGIAAVISHESHFQPAARSSRSSATGLIQFLESTAEKLGTTTAELAIMTALEQLHYVEAYFQRFMPRVPARPEDYILVTYGRPDAVGSDDAYVLDRRDSDDAHERARYAANHELDGAGTGAITVGDLRASMATVLRAAHGRYVHASSSGGAAGGLIVALLILGPPLFDSLRRFFR